MKNILSYTRDNDKSILCINDYYILSGGNSRNIYMRNKKGIQIQIYDAGDFYIIRFSDYRNIRLYKGSCVSLMEWREWDKKITFKYGLNLLIFDETGLELTNSL
jgi:hypothetical protein